MNAPQDSLVAVADKLKQERQARRRRVLLQLLMFVAAPTLVATIYFGLIASPVYSSEFVLSIQSASGSSEDGSRAKGDLSDAISMKTFVDSREMLKRIDADGSFSEHYSSGDIDTLSRLPSSAGSESRHRYYARRVSARVDERAGDLRVEINAYAPEAAVELAQEILAETKAKVSSLHAETRDREVASAQAEFERTRAALVAARRALTKARRSKPSLLNNDDASQVTPPSDGSKDAAPREDLLEDAEFEFKLAQADYDQAVRALSDARRLAVQQTRYVDVIAPPSAPTEPSGPLRLRTIVATLLIAFAFYSIGSLLLASIREHARL